jgi:Arc/MetJ-type ribon-helix-helix transcriptional regulator
MVVKKVMISLDEAVICDMDKLVKAGCYKNRSSLIQDALMQIPPLKTLADERFHKLVTQVIETANPLF